MKTMKLILCAILMMMAMCAQAQTIQVMKDGKVVKEYATSEVDSVVMKPYVDRNVYSDLACEQKLFDASKVVTGKTSIAGEAWANYSQYVVTIPEGVTELDIKVPFEIYQNDPLAGDVLRSCGDAKPWEGTYYKVVNPGQRFVILAKQ